MKIGDKVNYLGEYEDCRGFEYKITKVYKNYFGFDKWYDLEAIKPDILTHYETILSVLRQDIKAV